MTDLRRDSNPRASFFGTAQGRIITALGIIALVLGIVAEGIAITTAYYNMLKAIAESEAATARAKGIPYQPIVKSPSSESTGYGKYHWKSGE